MPSHPCSRIAESHVGRSRAGCAAGCRGAAPPGGPPSRTGAPTPPACSEPNTFLYMHRMGVMPQALECFAKPQQALDRHARVKALCRWRCSQKPASAWHAGNIQAYSKALPASSATAGHRLVMSQQEPSRSTARASDESRMLKLLGCVTGAHVRPCAGARAMWQHAWKIL